MSASPTNSSSGGRINLENFLDRPRFSSHILTSPRSIEACRMNGVEPEELLPKKFESFSGGGTVSRATLERRYKHGEERRMKILEKCRATRQELSDQGVGTPLSSPATPLRSRDSAGPSPAKLSSERNLAVQRQRYQQLEEERLARGREKTEALDEATEIASENRARRNEDVSQKGAQRWNKVCDTHDTALEQEYSRSAERYETFAERDQQRSNAAESTKMQRDENWRYTAQQREERNARIGQQANQRFNEEIDKKREKLTEVERRQMAAEEQLLERKESFNKRAVVSEEIRTDVRVRAKETELEKRNRRLRETAEKEARAAEALHALEEQRAQKEAEAQARNEVYYSTVSRASALAEERKQCLAESLHEKERSNLEFRTEQTMEKMEELELKREAQCDKIEDVNRSRKAQEYRKQQKHHQHVVECDYGHVSPKGSSYNLMSKSNSFSSPN